ncbi:DMT family transporter [Mycetocola tolaasinivorans]|uniref:DMT family transporter n=2 Tax=Mycetocola tolaasinivorans TaxID=76635 RepID=A0A3L6ZYK1_9MICO|nr:DMT family transporter [Mycetocola tolaasinivorans]
MAEGSERSAGSRRTLTQYVLLALVWGSSFFLVGIGLQDLAPTQVVLARLAIGAVALALVCFVSRQRLPRGGRIWAHLFVVAMLLCVVPFLLFAWAQQHVPSSVASIINATTPLMTMGVALLALPSERPDRWKVGGLGLGFIGILFVLDPLGGFDGETGPLGYIACLGATLSYGIAFVYMRRFVSPRGLTAIPVATAQVGLAAIVMVVLSPVIANQPFTISPAGAASMLVLGAFGTGLAYVWNASIVANWGATAASTVTYIAPVVGIALGVLALGESLAWYQPVGAIVVVLGILVGQGRVPWAGLGAQSKTPSPRRGGFYGGDGGI